MGSGGGREGGEEESEKGRVLTTAIQIPIIPEGHIPNNVSYCQILEYT